MFIGSRAVVEVDAETGEVRAWLVSSGEKLCDVRARFTTPDDDLEAAR